METTRDNETDLQGRQIFGVEPLPYFNPPYTVHGTPTAVVGYGRAALHYFT